MTMFFGGCIGILLAAEFVLHVWANNASWPRPGPSWLNDDDENVEEPQPQQQTKSKIIFKNQHVKNAFATFTCDEVVEAQMTASVPRVETKAFEKLKKCLEKINNMPLTDSEVSRGIYYYNSRVLKREPQRRISWKTPEARAALLRYQTQMKLKQKRSPRELLKADIIDSTSFKEFKRSIETFFGYTFNNDILYHRASVELRNMRHSFECSFSNPTYALCQETSTVSFQKHATAQDSSSVQISPAVNALKLIDWSHPEVASAFRAFQLEFPREWPPSQTPAQIIASAAFRKFKKAVERIYNCRLTNNLFYDFVQARLCLM